MTSQTPYHVSVSLPFNVPRAKRVAEHQQTQYRNHITREGRYAICPHCGPDAPRQVVLGNGDAVSFFCPNCENDVTTCALPSNNEEISVWAEYSHKVEDPADPLAWGFIDIGRMERNGCVHPRHRRVKYGTGHYGCEKCGHEWDMVRNRDRQRERIEAVKTALATDPEAMKGLSRAVSLFKKMNSMRKEES